MFVYVLAIALYVADAHAFEIPGYIKDPQDIKTNIDAIIKYNTPNAKSSKTAEETERQSAIQLNQYIASLYGKAIAIRAEYLGSERASSIGAGIDVGEIGDAVGEASEAVDNEKLSNAASTGANVLKKAAKLAKSIDGIFENMAAEDKNQALQQNVKESLRRSAVIINRVVALEAEIVNLEAMLRLKNVAGALGSRPEEEE